MNHRSHQQQNRHRHRGVGHGLQYLPRWPPERLGDQKNARPRLQSRCILSPRHRFLGDASAPSSLFRDSPSRHVLDPEDKQLPARHMIGNRIKHKLLRSRDSILRAHVRLCTISSDPSRTSCRKQVQKYMIANSLLLAGARCFVCVPCLFGHTTGKAYILLQHQAFWHTVSA